MCLAGSVYSPWSFNYLRQVASKLRSRNQWVSCLENPSFRCVSSLAHVKFDSVKQDISTESASSRRIPPVLDLHNSQAWSASLGHINALRVSRRKLCDSELNDPSSICGSFEPTQRLLELTSLLGREDTMEYSLCEYASHVQHIPDLHRRMATAHGMNMSHRGIPPSTGLLLGVLATIKYHSDNNSRNTMPTIMGVASSSSTSQTYGYTPAPGTTPAQRQAHCDYRVKLNPESCRRLLVPKSVNYTAGNCVEWETIITEINKLNTKLSGSATIVVSSRHIRGHQAERCFCDLCISYVQELLKTYPYVVIVDTVSNLRYSTQENCGKG